MTNAVEMHGVAHGYEDAGGLRMVFEHIDLQVAAGEIVALVGRSGSGKSTLLNLVAGLDRPLRGRVVVAGVDLADAGERRRTLLRRQHTGMVFQAFHLLPTLTVSENLRLPLELNGISGQQRRVRELLASVGLAGRGDAFPDALSGGEQQRVALARALVHEPAVILADEPTGNLDTTTGAEVAALLRELVRQHGRTLLMATHSDALAGLADRVLQLEGGQLSAAPRRAS